MEILRADRPALFVHAYGQDNDEAVLYPTVGRVIHGYTPMYARPCVTYFNGEPTPCHCGVFQLEALHP